MVCMIDGVPASLVAGQLDHWQFSQVTRVAQGDQIDFSFVATHHCKMEMFSAHWDAVPTAVESLLLFREATDPGLNTVYRIALPAASQDALTDFVCVTPFVWEKGETIRFTYANTDDQVVGVQISLIEIKVGI